jgi:hypothetical protein
VKVDQEIIDKLKLTEEDLLMLDTPFAHMEKEGIIHVFALGDKIFSEIQSQKDIEREAKKQLKEEEAIHKDKDKMIPYKRSFF